ncbi:MAG: diversity-generating retroelement protein Avd [Bryobacteraceae bacterium]
MVQKAYDWNLWIVPKVENFPKSQRFSIGQQILQSSLDLLMHLVDATYQKKNASNLGGAARDVNRVRYLIRLSKDLKAINLGAYEFASQNLDEIGRMTGGWLKHSRERGE